MKRARIPTLTRTPVLMLMLALASALLIPIGFAVTSAVDSSAPDVSPVAASASATAAAGAPTAPAGGTTVSPGATPGPATAAAGTPTASPGTPTASPGTPTASPGTPTASPAGGTSVPPGVSGPATPAEGTAARKGERIPGRYVVVLRPSAELRLPSQVQTAARELAGRHRGRLGHVYSAALRGFSIGLSDAGARALAKDPRVAYVEPDTLVHATSTQADPSWSLDRIDQPNPALSDTYSYDTDASNVSIYVLDTGVRFTHTEFGGRVQNGPPTADNDDCGGHGTAVAGAAAAATWGVAKKASIYSVRVLDCAGAGPATDAIAAMDWVTTNAKRPAVANISWMVLGTHDALDEAVRGSVRAGITYSIAAGNSDADACNFSPQRVTEAITVGATDGDDARASWSDYGPCVDLFAPGTGIMTTSYSSDTATTAPSGTSVSAPIAAGAAALYLAAHPSATPQQTRDALVACASGDVISDPGAGSPNKLLSTRCNRPVMLTNPGRQFMVKGKAVSLRKQTASTTNSGQTLTYRATGLPAGLSINASTGEISGSPRAGRGVAEVSAADGTGALASTSFGWQVVEGLGPIVGLDGACVDDRSRGTDNGNAIQMWGCNQTPAQQWTVRSDGRLEVLGKCMTVSGNSTADAAPIVLYDCGTAGSQVWRPQADGTLLNPASGRCLNAPNSGWGTQLTLATCTGG
ncbi:MAG TPA: S8 family serine peptidase, partial [Mycobacteriales bacterium]